MNKWYFYNKKHVILPSKLLQYKTAQPARNTVVSILHCVIVCACVQRPDCRESARIASLAMHKHRNTHTHWRMSTWKLGSRQFSIVLEYAWLGNTVWCNTIRTGSGQATAYECCSTPTPTYLKLKLINHLSLVFLLCLMINDKIEDQARTHKPCILRITEYTAYKWATQWMTIKSQSQ